MRRECWSSRQIRCMLPPFKISGRRHPGRVEQRRKRRQDRNIQMRREILRKDRLGKRTELSGRTHRGDAGTPRLDYHNPDSAKRSRPILGLQIVNDFIFAGENVWKGGTVYDPKSGNTYRGKMTLISPDVLDLRGFIGIPLFGRTTTWTR